MVAFTLFNNLADFMGRVNNVVGWFDNIDRFMGSGGTQSESQINVEQINELTTRLDDLATDVESKIEHRMFMFQCITASLLWEKNLKKWNIQHYMFGIQCLNFVVGRILLYGLNPPFGRSDIGRRIYKKVLF